MLIASMDKKRKIKERDEKRKNLKEKRHKIMESMMKKKPVE